MSRIPVRGLDDIQMAKVDALNVVLGSELRW